ncbi:hypothetical protein QUF74_04855 [Candidatus Halobeggiatoa sp. HSG11]|nr:hypothetical protein [Candidatus Halobeggiatoa sp. HSG11]
MEERNFYDDELLQILNKNVTTIVVPSPKDKTVDLYFGKVKNKYIMVVVNRNTCNVVTVRNMRKNEKIAYMNGVNNVN